MSSASFEFGPWLRALRKELGLTRQMVSERSGRAISQQYIHFIETGKNTNIGSEKLGALAQGLGVPLWVLQRALFEKTEPVVPVVGRAAAGVQVASNAEEYGEAASYRHQLEEVFAVEVIGDSMAPRLEHGDLVFVKRFYAEDRIIPGWIYLFEEVQSRKVTCKYLLEQEGNSGSYRLEAEDATLFPPTAMGEDFRLLGRVVEVRKTKNLFTPLVGEALPMSDPSFGGTSDVTVCPPA